MARLRSRWSGLSGLSRILLVLSAVASAIAAVILALVAYTYIGDYAVGSHGVVIGVSVLLFWFAGLPSMLLCGLLWAGYWLSRRRRTRPDHESTGGSHT
jgi:hypothetical protein